MPVTCPLSDSPNVVRLATVKTIDLVKMYRRRFGVDVSSELAGLEEIELYHCPDSDLKFFHPMVTGPELFYEKLQEFKWYYLEEKYEYCCANEYINASDAVLEIGCGKGAFAQRIVARRYVGLELSQKAVGAAAGSGITALRQSIQEHAAANPGQYDVVCAFQVLEHVAEIRSFIASSLKCLKPGGRLIYSVPSADSFLSLTTNYVLNMPPHHVSWWSDRCLHHVAEVFGLKVFAVRHEQLAAMHRRWYAATIALESLKTWLHLKRPMLDASLWHEILWGGAVLAGMFLSKGLVDPRVLPVGHSVTAVYQKQ